MEQQLISAHKSNPSALQTVTDTMYTPNRTLAAEAARSCFLAIQLIFF